MNKCLVTTLKAQTNNEALSKYNVLTIKTKAIETPTFGTQWFSINTLGDGNVSIESSSVGMYQSGISGALQPYPITVPVYGGIEKYFENKDGIIEVTGKYNLSSVVVGDAGTVRMKEIYGIPGTINRLVLRKIEEGEVDVTKLANALDFGKLIAIDLPAKGGDLAVDMVNRLSKNTLGEFKDIQIISPAFCLLFDSRIGLDDLINHVKVADIIFYQLGAGNLSSLAKMTNLTRIIFSDSAQNNGDIMDFINPWIQAGRTSGKIDVPWISGQRNITLNGQPVAYPSGVSGLNVYLNWTSDGTVTFTAS